MTKNRGTLLAAKSGIQLARAKTNRSKIGGNGVRLGVMMNVSNILQIDKKVDENKLKHKHKKFFCEEVPGEEYVWSAGKHPYTLNLKIIIPAC